MNLMWPTVQHLWQQEEVEMHWRHISLDEYWSNAAANSYSTPTAPTRKWNVRRPADSKGAVRKTLPSGVQILDLQRSFASPPSAELASELRWPVHTKLHTWIPPSSLLIHLKTRRFTLNKKRTLRRAELSIWGFLRNMQDGSQLREKPYMRNILSIYQYKS